MADFGAQSGWQILSLGPGCHSTSRVIQARLLIKNFALVQNSVQFLKQLWMSWKHEFLHALGFFHEQSRSDRDNYITVYDTASSYNKIKSRDFFKVPPIYGGKFEMDSVMMYSTRTRTSGKRHVTLAGEDIDPANWITTKDSLQLFYKYCMDSKFGFQGKV